MSAPENVTYIREHMSLKEGDVDPELNKLIKSLVICSELFIVYLSDDYSIQWRTVGAHEPAKHFGEVLNRVASLEMRSRFISDKSTLLGIRHQIAEGLARCLEGRPLASSSAILKEVELEVQARNREVSWGWYFGAAYPIGAGCAVGIFILWIFRNYFRGILGGGAFEVALGAFCGAIGALLSVTSRGDRLVMDANAGKPIHNLEGISRVGAGIGGAFFAALAVKSGIILGGAHFFGSKLALLMAVCVAAGASERFIPSLVKNIEKIAHQAGEKDRQH
ncbi:hypothetical protein [Burkholderia sp. Ac-20379]|uniref:hypothetical protein n=1 Tax=Burkholderia sp. Ac-20379 TaxID=2703900 RepID=UPI0019811DCE|nr:hypothetical protein [Burkholderia sp. Ac-20379]MBN3724363.1 hypothetical protein [Burkholderia sp. Ac-20379]